MSLHLLATCFIVEIFEITKKTHSEEGKELVFISQTFPFRHLYRFSDRSPQLSILNNYTRFKKFLSPRSTFVGEIFFQK